MDRQRRGVTAVIVMERSFFSNRWVFTELAYERNYLKRGDYEHLAYFFDVCIKGWKHFPRMDAIILLRAPVDEVNCGRDVNLKKVWMAIVAVLGASPATRSSG